MTWLNSTESCLSPYVQLPSGKSHEGGVGSGFEQHPFSKADTAHDVPHQWLAQSRMY